MSELTIEKVGPKDIAAIFDEDSGEGFFFLYDTVANRVLRLVRIYEHATTPELIAQQVEILWSSDEKRAGIALWGRMRAVLPINEEEEQIACNTQVPEDQAIEAALLTDFPQYFDRRAMLNIRKRYWNNRLLETHPNAAISNAPLLLTETAFMKAAFDSRRERAVIFEDDGETGYLYLVLAKTEEITKHLHIYDRNVRLTISADDVDVLWSTDESKCAVSIWGEIRGIIDLMQNKEGRVWMESRATPGITDRTWLRGFELM